VIGYRRFGTISFPSSQERQFEKDGLIDPGKRDRQIVPKYLQVVAKLRPQHPRRAKSLTETCLVFIIFYSGGQNNKKQQISQFYLKILAVGKLSQSSYGSAYKNHKVKIKIKYNFIYCNL
jgi:hypothetical protein